MKPLRLRNRLLLIALLPAILLAGSYAAWWLVAGGPPGAWGHALLVLASIAAAGGVAHWLERQLASECDWLVRSVRRIRGGEFGRVSGRWTEPVVEELAGEIDALAEEIERNQRNLHDRIGEATRELQETLSELEARNAELEAARAEAEAASEFKSRFLANISHEIRTPMNSILGFTELLDESALDPVQVDYLATIRSSAQSLLSLLNGILDLSKIESGRMELEHCDSDVNELLFETYHLFAPQAFGKGVELHVAPAAPTDARVRVDPTRLKQVLINLTSNAVKFTDEGYVCIGVDAAPRADGGVALTFSFTDTGRGIPPDAQTQLFQAFAQGQQPGVDLRLRPAGTGLGLHIASEIVFLMDGLLEFRSEPGAGSEFWFHLEVPRAHHMPPGAGNTGAARRAAVLVAAEPTAARLEADLLAMAGIEVRTCPDADAAVELLDGPLGPAAEAVLVHVAAAELHDGDPCALDARLAARDLPVLAYTYAHSPAQRRQLLAAGYHGVLDRTPEPATLATAFARAVDGVDPAAGPGDAVERHPPRTPGGATFDVLVVDDQPVNLKLLEHYLEGTPYRPTPAQGSNEALYQAGLHRFDAILMDIHLPERDGIDTARRLRVAGALNARTPIVAVTADAFAERARAALGAGMNDVLVKPVGRGELLERLAEWCGTAPRDAPSPAARTPGTPDRADPGDDALVYDPDDGLRRAGGRDEVAAELFDMLLGHLPASRRELQDAAAEGDPARLRSAAHRLKGATAYCGVPCLRAELERLERTIDAGGAHADAVRRVIAAIDAVAALDGCPARPVAISEVMP